MVVADVSEESNRETARMIEESGGRALAVTCNVMRSDDGWLRLMRGAVLSAAVQYEWEHGIQQKAERCGERNCSHGRIHG